MNQRGIIQIPIILIILLAIAGLFFFGAGDLSLGIFFDDFSTEDDFSIPDSALVIGRAAGANPICQAETVNSWNCIGERWDSHLFDPQGDPGGFIDIEDGRLRIETLTTTSSNTYVTFKKDLKNRDIKVLMEIVIGSLYPGNDDGFTITFNNVEAYSFHALDLGSPGFSFTVDQDILFEAILDIEDPNIYHIVVNGQFVKSITVPQNELKIKFQPFAGGGGGTLVGASLWIDSIKSRPYFNCEVEADEQPIRDVFDSGSTFNIHDLTFKPVKFCPDAFPIVKRSLSEEGVRTDVRGQLFRKLTTAQDITVGNDEIMIVNYVADYTEDMGERCTIDQAYDPDTKKCVKRIFEAEDIVQIINNREFIIVGKNQKTFRDSIQIADKTIISSAPAYFCAEETPRANAPNPLPSCWNTIVSYGGQEIIFIPGEEKDIDEFFKLKYIPSASFKDGAIEDNYANQFILTLKNRDLLQMETVEENESAYFVKLGSDRDVNYGIKNNYGHFSEDQSGVQIRETKDLLFSEKTYREAIGFQKGSITYNTKLDSEEFGQVRYQINPWFKIGDEIFFDDEQIVRNFEVVDETPENVKFVKGTTEGTIVKQKSLFQRFIDFILNFILGLFK